MYLVQIRACDSPVLQSYLRYCRVQSTKNPLRVRLRAVGSVSCSSNRNAQSADVMVFDETFEEELTLCVEGNIGVGKTTFLQSLLSEHSKDTFQIVPEPVDIWQNVFGRASSSRVFNILETFYAEPSRYAYTFQNYVFMTRFIQEKTTRGSGCPIRIMERSVLSDRNVFTESLSDKSWLTELEYCLYQAWFDPMIKNFPTLVPDGFIYLRADPDTCMRRLRRRARCEELHVDLPYLLSLHDKHERWLNCFHAEAYRPQNPAKPDIHEVLVETDRMRKVPVLVIDCNTDMDTCVERWEPSTQHQQEILNFCKYIRERAHSRPE